MEFVSVVLILVGLVGLFGGETTVGGDREGRMNGVKGVESVAEL